MKRRSGSRWGDAVSRKPEYNFGRWQVMRERAQIPDPEPPPLHEKAAHISSVVRQVLKGLRLDGSAWMRSLEEKWRTVVGPEVAKHARPGRWDGRCLVIYVDSSPWLSELARCFKASMLQNIRKVPGGEQVRELAFLLDPESRGKVSAPGNHAQG